MANAFRRSKNSKRWTATYTGADGTTKKHPGFHDKQETIRLAKRLEDEARKRRYGLTDDVADRLASHGRRPVSEHVESYRSFLESKGGDPAHVRATINAIHEVAEACGWLTLASMDGPMLSNYLRDYGRERAARTVNARRQAMRGFARWCVSGERLARDPFAAVAPRASHTKARERRALDDDEIMLLLNATEAGPPRLAMDGPRRVMLYRVAIGTGLRAGELASLTPASFDLNAPSVTVEAAYSKRRRRDTQPIRQDLATALRPWLALQKPHKPLWPIRGKRTALMLAEDLEAAGVPVADDAGRVADFHALRHTYITRLARSGVTPKVAQTLARHSTITLTMDRYSHVAQEDQTKALDKLPSLDPGA